MRVLSTFVLSMLLLVACQSAVDDVPGCTYETALNYNPEATIDDGSCVFEGEENTGCIDGTGSVSYHGYDYSVVQIGDQCWFSENLRTQVYANGDSILDPSQAYTWYEPLYIDFGYEFDPSGDSIVPCILATGMDFDCDSAAQLYDMGRLYTWFAAHDVRNICPSGWHIPTRMDWFSLFEFMGVSNPSLPSFDNPSGNVLWSDQNIGHRLMLTNGGWNPSVPTGDNSLGFSAIPSAQINSWYWYLGYSSTWWSSQTSTNADAAESWTIVSGTDGVIFDNLSKATVHSCRCIQD